MTDRERAFLKYKQAQDEYNTARYNFTKKPCRATERVLDKADAKRTQAHKEWQATEQ